MARLHDLTARLQRCAAAADLQEIDLDEVRELLGELSARSIERLISMKELLLDAGYCTVEGSSLRLTARGTRRIGEKILADVFRRVDRRAQGEHRDSRTGPGLDSQLGRKPYEFGDPFLLDTSTTLMNAVSRGERSPGLKLTPADFEVSQTEKASRAATVLLVDMSRSMHLRQCSVAARRVALALHALIRARFPRDHLYLVGFSDYGRVLAPHALFERPEALQPRGTNIQHGLAVARQVLSPHRGGTRQILLLSDGEPTSHAEGGDVVHAYPPSARTLDATLREVNACTREGIRINTYMLAFTPDLVDFVKRITEMNRGRALYATPDRLDEYVLADYARQRR
jgi:uncharacterized protein with von Willebrand factor type A (vWA) domain